VPFEIVRIRDSLNLPGTIPSEMEQGMTARLDAIGSDDPESALSRAASGDDPLTIFQPEPRKFSKGSSDSAALCRDDIPGREPSVAFATSGVNDGEQTAGVVNRIKRVLRTLDIARDFEKTVDNRLAALRGLDQEVRDRALRLECLNRDMTVGAAHADDILRVIGSFERPLAELQRHQQDLRSIETTVAAFENRAEIALTSLGRQVAGCEAREAAAVDAMEQLGRRAADTIDNLEGRVGDCEARAHVAENTIMRLDDVSSRTLPALRERAKEAEEQSQSLQCLVAEALRMSISLTALEERLPAVGQCDQDLARIELAVSQIARQLEDLNAGAEQQSQALAVQQERVRQTRDESQKTADFVSELEGRIVDLSGSHQQLDRLEACVAQLEQRTTSAATALKHVTDVRAGLELEVIQLQNQLRPLTESALSEVKKLTTVADETTMRLAAARQEAERYQREETSRASAVLAGLEARMAEIGRTHREINAAEREVEQLEQRAAAAAGEVRHATRAKGELQHEIAKCQRQIARLTTAARGEAKNLKGLRRHVLTLRFRRRGPKTSRGFSPARLIFGGAAFALSAAIVLLVSIVWRISPVANQRPARPLPSVVLASRALALAPALAVAAVPVPRVVLSEAPPATTGVPSAAVGEQSVSKEERTPKFVGTLLIESDPAGAAAFVNGEPVGNTPVLLKDLRAGSYVVRLEHEGYQRWSSAATVSAVRQERVKAKLEPERSR
jgi:hypothetical protein